MTKAELYKKACMLPLLPGVYIMLDASGEVIYVGKAKALKNRVTSYFRGDHLPKVAAMPFATCSRVFSVAASMVYPSSDRPSALFCCANCTAFHRNGHVLSSL